MSDTTCSRRAALGVAAQPGSSPAGHSCSANTPTHLSRPTLSSQPQTMNPAQVKGHLKGLRGKAAAKEADRRARRLDARLGKLDKKLEVARAGLDQQLSAGWRTFEGLRDVLIAAGGRMQQQVDASGATHTTACCRVLIVAR